MFERKDKCTLSKYILDENLVENIIAFYRWAKGVKKIIKTG